MQTVVQHSTLNWTLFSVFSFIHRRSRFVSARRVTLLYPYTRLDTLDIFGVCFVYGVYRTMCVPWMYALCIYSIQSSFNIIAIIVVICVHSHTTSHPVTRVTLYSVSINKLSLADDTTAFGSHGQNLSSNTAR